MPPPGTARRDSASLEWTSHSHISKKQQVQPNEKKLRIAQVAPLWTSIPPTTYGGIELIVHLLSEELVRRGHQVTLFASGDSKTSGELRSVCHRNLLDLMTACEASVYEYYTNAIVTEALLSAGEFDVLHFHVGPQWVPMGALCPAPALFSLHTFLSEDDQWVVRRYPRVPLCAISRFQVASVGGAGLTQEIPVVYNGCDFDAYTPSYEKGTYLAFLGRMSFDKNPLDAIRIAQAVGLPLLLAGRPQDAEESEYFETQIKPLIDGENIRYIGPVNHEQKNELLRGAAALLFPVQWAEPFGLVMIEAMACGTPVVACDLGAVREVIDPGITGFYHESVEELAALTRLAIGLDRAAVRRHAAERFSFQRMVDDYLNIYHALARHHE
jgi:glycosyltransferase involved in cell wall biosynthesis